MTRITLTRIKLIFASRNKITLTVGDHKVLLANGDTQEIELPEGEHEVSAISQFGNIYGTVILPAHKEIEVGFTVTNSIMKRRFILIGIIFAVTIFLYQYFDSKWAFVLPAVSMLPSIITNRKALYVDVIGEEITAPIHTEEA